MQFRRVTASKYIGTDGYTLIQSKSGEFSICKDGKVTNWGTGFQSVKCAENFLRKHDYIRASDTFLPIADDDICFIEEMYGFTPTGNDEFKGNNLSFKVSNAGDGTNRLTFKGKDCSTSFCTIDSALKWLDERIPLTGVVSSVCYRGTDLRSILAAKGKRNPREITRNLVRVKSSNVWAYGVEIKDNNSKVGDVYVQFKAKNGGPGDVYRYYDVPITLWKKVLASPSKGHAVWKYLRSNFLYSKLTGDKKGKLKNAVN